VSDPSGRRKMGRPVYIKHYLPATNHHARKATSTRAARNSNFALGLNIAGHPLFAFVLEDWNTNFLVSEKRLPAAARN
jgi:hypothetical protein